MSDDTLDGHRRPEGSEREQALEAEVFALRAKTMMLEARIAELVGQLDRSADASAFASPMTVAPVPRAQGPSVSAPPLPPIPTAAPAGGRAAFPPTAPPMMTPMSSSGAPPAPPPVPTQIRSTQAHSGPVPAQFDLERFIGRRVAPLVGAVAVTGGVGFFVYYAIDTGLWGAMPAGIRFSVGLVIGAILLLAAEFVRRRAAGAAVGLDAAGIGAFLITVGVGHALDLYGLESGALLTAAAGLFGAVWSVRTRSAVVGSCAYLGLFIAPLVYGMLSRSPVLVGALFTVAAGSGVAMHALADAASRGRFEAVRFLALAGTFISGSIIAVSFLQRGMPSAEEMGFVLIWYALFVGSAALAAVRGDGRFTNIVLVALASIGAFILQMGCWGASAPGDLRAWFPSLCGGILAGTGLFLWSFVPPKPEPAEHQDPREGIDRTSEACAALSSVALGVGVAMLLGGLVHFVPSSGRAVAVAAIAIGCTITAQRTKLQAFDAISIVASLIALLLACGSAIGAATSGTHTALTMISGTTLRLNLSADLASAVAVGVLLFVQAGLRVRLSTDTLRAALAVLGWIAPSLAMLDDMVYPGAFALPGVVFACIPALRRTLVVSGLSLLPMALMSWLLVMVLVDDSSLPGWSRVEFGLAALLPFTWAAVGGGLHPSTGEARPAIVAVGMAATTLCIAVLAAVASVAAELPMVDAVLAFVAASSIVGAMLLLSLRYLPAGFTSEAAGAGAVVILLAALIGSVHGLAILCGSASREPPSVLLAVAAIAGVGLAALGWWRTRTVQPAFIGQDPRPAGGVFAASAVPLGAVLLASVVPGGTNAGLGALALAAWVVLVGVAEIAIGFAWKVPALRWGGLIAFVFLVMRLFLVDLSGAPTLVRVGLLMATGLALVGIGIVYARSGRDRPSGSGTIAP